MNKLRTKQIKTIQKKLALADEHLSLLEQALTHPTFFEGKKKRTEDNQRLEFLGDAILDFVVGEYLYKAYPQSQEGDLTKMRSLLVCEASLAIKSAELGIDKALRLGKGAELSGDRQRPSILADALEAVIGAVYLGCGFQAVSEFVTGLFLPDMQDLTRDDFEDSKSLLQELVQKRTGRAVVYRILSLTGPAHDREFVSGVYFKQLLLGEGAGKSKKESEQDAAGKAWKNRRQWLKKIK
ncbi:MAG: ribonuclease III [Bacillota bacterium]|jgi:ribonuclease-3